MNGMPQHDVCMRSISLYGLSDVIMTFEDGTDNYFARQVAFERHLQGQLPTGVTPGLSPLFEPGGLIYATCCRAPTARRRS